jgi:molybdate transport system permease protein
MKHIRNHLGHKSIWIFILPSLFILLLLGLPVMALVLRAIDEDFLSSALTPTALAALRLSLVTSIISVLFTLTAGMPLAYVLARWKFRGKSFLELLVDLPVVLPPSVAGLALLMAFGRSGLLGPTLGLAGISLPFTTLAVILAQTFVSAPLFIRAARVGFAEVEPRLEEAARVEGANEWQVFQHVMIPLSGRSLLTGMILAWARALGEFGATILFAGNLEGVTQTMPLAIYLGLERGLGTALALSVFLVIVSVALLGIIRRLEKKGH